MLTGQVDFNAIDSEGRVRVAFKRANRRPEVGETAEVGDPEGNTCRGTVVVIHYERRMFWVWLDMSTWRDGPC